MMEKFSPFGKSPTKTFPFGRVVISGREPEIIQTC